jgi:GNAT superfamily N-acetyltransferase
MSDVRPAGPQDRDLVARIAAEGFFADPVMGWVFRDPDRRLDQLVELFGGLFDDMVPDRGVVHLLDVACTALWRRPDFDEARPARERAPDSAAEPPSSSFSDEEVERLIILGGLMAEGHPHERHWYLNVVSTRPSHQGQGLGAAVLAPVLEDADDRGWPCYLESSNPRNVSLYLRHGFVETGQLHLPDGPHLTQMWREPVDRD